MNTYVFDKKEKRTINHWLIFLWLVSGLEALQNYLFLDRILSTTKVGATWIIPIGIAIFTFIIYSLFNFLLYYFTYKKQRIFLLMIFTALGILLNLPRELFYSLTCVSLLNANALFSFYLHASALLFSVAALIYYYYLSFQMIKINRKIKCFNKTGININTPSYPPLSEDEKQLKKHWLWVLIIASVFPLLLALKSAFTNQPINNFYVQWSPFITIFGVLFLINIFLYVCAYKKGGTYFLRFWLYVSLALIPITAILLIFVPSVRFDFFAKYNSYLDLACIIASWATSIYLYYLSFKLLKLNKKTERLVYAEEVQANGNDL